VLARPKRFELLTPRFVVCCRGAVRQFRRHLIGLIVERPVRCLPFGYWAGHVYEHLGAYGGRWRVLTWLNDDARYVSGRANITDW
jgi:hypothetical protein